MASEDHGGVPPQRPAGTVAPTWEATRYVDEREPSTQAPTCYRHPDRDALLRCSRCERPICADDAIEAPVGYQCPECARGAAPVRRLGDLVPRAQVTRLLVIVIGALYVLTRVDGGAVIDAFALQPFAAGNGAWWRLVTSGFLHVNLMHVGFNGLLLWQLGHMLEPALGHVRFGVLYVAGLVGGSLGVVGLSWLTVSTALTEIPVLGTVLATSPLGFTLGASGAVFGLMGAAMSGMYRAGVDPWQSGIGGLVVLNLIITFLIPTISVGGHVGGLAAGYLAGRLLFVARERTRSATLVALVVTVAMFALTIVLADATAATTQALLRS